MKNSFSIITTCRGRLHHLKQTLPAMLAQGADEVIVVDYGCPGGTGDWVAANHPDVKVVRAEDPGGFSLARARNAGAAAARGEWLAFVDADSILAAGALSWFDRHCAPGIYYIIEKRAGRQDAAGTMVCRRSDFALAGLYDDAIRGWGAEDTDLRLRLSALGLRDVPFPAALISSITHGDEVRDRAGAMSMTQLRLRSKLYLHAKLAMNRRYGGLPLCCREALLAAATEAVTAPGVERAQDCHPFRFHRYCAACARKMSANRVLFLDRRPFDPLRRGKFRLREGRTDPGW